MQEPVVRNSMSPYITTALSLCLFAALLSIAYAVMKQSELDTLLRYGIDDMNRHKYESAHILLSDAVKKQPKSARAFYYLSLVEARMADYDAARRNLQTAAKLGMSKPAVTMALSAIDLSTNNYETAAAYLKDLPESKANAELASLYRGMSEKQSQQYEQAVVDLTAATAAANKNVKAAAYHERAYIYFKQGNLPAAINDLTKSLDLVPTVLGYQHRADMERKMTNYSQAIADYSKAIHLAKAPNAELYFWRGRCQNALKHYSEAIDDFQMALHIQPALTPVKDALKQAYAMREELKKR